MFPEEEEDILARKVHQIFADEKFGQNQVPISFHESLERVEMD